MADEHLNVEAVKSKAAIGGHPIHPMLIPFPVAFLPGALVTDLVYRSTGDAFWARASLWLLAAGVVTGALAAVFGLIDFLSIRRARSLRAGWVHFLGNVLAMALSIFNLLLRWGEPVPDVPSLGVTLSAVVTLILVVTGWLGGELSYKHAIGVAGPPAGGGPVGAPPSRR